MTWAFSKICHVASLFQATRKSLKLLKALSDTKRDNVSAKVIEGAYEILMFWAIYGAFVVWESNFEFLFSWFPGYYYFKSTFILVVAFPEVKLTHLVFFDVFVPTVEKIYTLLEFSNSKNSENLNPIDFIGRSLLIFLLIIFPSLNQDIYTSNESSNEISPLLSQEDEPNSDNPFLSLDDDDKQSSTQNNKDQRQEEVTDDECMTSATPSPDAPSANTAGSESRDVRPQTPNSHQYSPYYPGAPVDTQASFRKEEREAQNNMSSVPPGTPSRTSTKPPDTPPEAAPTTPLSTPTPTTNRLSVRNRLLGSVRSMFTGDDRSSLRKSLDLHSPPANTLTRTRLRDSLNIGNKAPSSSLSQKRTTAASSSVPSPSNGPPNGDSNHYVTDRDRQNRTVGSATTVSTTKSAAVAVQPVGKASQSKAILRSPAQSPKDTVNIKTIDANSSSGGASNGNSGSSGFSTRGTGAGTGLGARTGSGLAATGSETKSVSGTSAGRFRLPLSGKLK